MKYTTSKMISIEKQEMMKVVLEDIKKQVKEWITESNLEDILDRKTIDTYSRNNVLDKVYHQLAKNMVRKGITDSLDITNLQEVLNNKVSGLVCVELGNKCEFVIETKKQKTSMNIIDVNDSIEVDQEISLMIAAKEQELSDYIKEEYDLKSDKEKEVEDFKSDEQLTVEIKSIVKKNKEEEKQEVEKSKEYSDNDLEQILKELDEEEMEL